MATGTVSGIADTPTPRPASLGQTQTQPVTSAAHTAAPRAKSLRLTTATSAAHTPTARAMSVGQTVTTHVASSAKEESVLGCKSTAVPRLCLFQLLAAAGLRGKPGCKMAAPTDPGCSVPIAPECNLPIDRGCVASECAVPAAPRCAAPTDPACPAPIGSQCAVPAIPRCAASKSGARKRNGTATPPASVMPAAAALPA